MCKSCKKNVVELFPFGSVSVLSSELRHVANRIDEVLIDFCDELHAAELQRLRHCLDDFDDIVIFLRALSSV